MSHTYTLTQHRHWNNIFRQWKLPLYFSKSVLNHITHFVDGMLSSGFTGTLTDIHRESLHHRDRRSLSHFLSHGKWDEQFLKQIVRNIAYQQVKYSAKHNNSPIFVIVDDTVCEKTKPSSRAVDSIQGSAFHHSHLKGKKVYGHAVVEAMLRAGDIVYPFATERYESKSKSKIDLACDMIRQVPRSHHQTYVLMDSWYPSASVLQVSSEQGFHVISGLKTNRIIYPQGIRQSIKEFASFMSKSDTDLVTIGEDSYRVYRYEGKLNLLDNGVVLFCWKEGEELNPKQVKAFLSTDVSLTNKQILSYYSKRWSIETYFRTAKVHLGLDRYQVRSTKAIDRYWALLSFVSMCCIYSGQGYLLDGLHQYRREKKQHWIEYVYKQALSGVALAQIQTQLGAA
ncbi:transposase [Paenibacillus dendritiformis]|uniref:IS701 family transposase n=1 Tax=Paenibacillus dendritiformis TaxID=130049 RepID=UPI0018CD364B|nr:IS701 family transposase [Paenibacillus dendritiformis]MBG9791697.1 transposase [Paenibacillus dendritiformis]MBG9792180.1 transposase [Paenibacillus dendritiformis]MBG9792454.1 transposase [Paenibacillus dendritiformis]MBG9794356.1 transposase [Paenibacillus dendritiformis]MBG9795578.1 transposase [Paenibacillus dendritiformis]